MLNVLPVRDMILAEELTESVSKGGIFIPETYVDKDKSVCRKVRVIAVGPGIVHVTNEGAKIQVTVSDMCGAPIEPGTVLLTTKYVQMVNVDDRRLRLFRAEDVSAVYGA